jgi:hypothetical protein
VSLLLLLPTHFSLSFDLHHSVSPPIFPGNQRFLSVRLARNAYNRAARAVDDDVPATANLNLFPIDIDVDEEWHCYSEQSNKVDLGSSRDHLLPVLLSGPLS